MVTAKELREFDEAKLAEQLTQTQEELFKLRFQHATAQLEKTHRLNELKTDIARIKTVMSQKKSGR
ncbi:50S ribosomal protein L29 [Fundidesulfovibrio magnetotacticus]|uniref:Large ribosomal subunit protein uL29 n=1 Tax=Fundidesulfovibrio magnetotacticus TaxID=2730080 RepID=A0A6V8LZI9_9BACT|nr:50S ribosomal protein L29 [Fundidesulfovibrio magnetotacticus]GFK95638.1 50S ribosomal protein L29 [Fundidesulfovibrio magnetotacticus]